MFLHITFNYPLKYACRHHSLLKWASLEGSCWVVGSYWSARFSCVCQWYQAMLCSLSTEQQDALGWHAMYGTVNSVCSSFREIWCISNLHIHSPWWQARNMNPFPMIFCLTCAIIELYSAEPILCKITIKLIKSRGVSLQPKTLMNHLARLLLLYCNDDFALCLRSSYTHVAI